MAVTVSGSRYSIGIVYQTEGNDKKTKSLSGINYDPAGGGSTALGLNAEGVVSLCSDIAESIMGATPANYSTLSDMVSLIGGE